jgi:hypothetical protein
MAYFFALALIVVQLAHVEASEQSVRVKGSLECNGESFPNAVSLFMFDTYNAN